MFRIIVCVACNCCVPGFQCFSNAEISLVDYMSTFKVNGVNEHTRNTKVFKKGSNVATHAWLNDHSIDFKSAHVIDKGNFRVRKTLESWHTAISSDADNNAKQLPRQYSILL